MITTREQEIWRAAMTLANNLCVQESDRHNDDDEWREATAAANCASRICGWLEPGNEALEQLFAEAGVSAAQS